MTIGMCLEYLDEYFKFYQNNEEKEEKVRKANQSDFDSF